MRSERSRAARRIAGLALAASLAAAGVHGASASARSDYEAGLHQAPAALHPVGRLGHAWVGASTGISNGWTVSNGELVASDRPFDDTGADTVPGNGGTSQRTARAATLPGLCGPQSSYATGDLSYPSGPDYLANAADLVELRLAVTPTTVHVLFQLETLISRSTTAVQLLIDADGNRAGGTFAGFEHVLTVTGDGASLDGRTVRSVTDLAHNTVEAAFPRSWLPNRTWRVNAVAGVRSGAGMGAVADAAYVADEPVIGAAGCRLDTVQAGELARGRLDAITVDPARLAKGGSDPLALRRGGFTRAYPPTLELGEGTIPQPLYDQQSSANIYRGVLQPYSIYVPKSYDPRHPSPVIMMLHCLICTHTVFDIAAFPSLAHLAESRGAIIAMPFGYGEGGWWEGAAEDDVFEVLADVSRRYNVDQDRLYLTGMSMGAYGTMRLGLLHPDLWASLLAVETATTAECVTPRPDVPPCNRPFTLLTIFPNARSLPVGIVQGSADELTPVTAGRFYADTFASLGSPFRYWEIANRTHDPSLEGQTSDVTSPWIGNARRNLSPHDVTFVVDRAETSRSEAYDRAYWLSGLRLSATAATGRVDATSSRGDAYRTSPTSGNGSSLAGSWTMRGLDRLAAHPSTANAVTLTTTGLTAATIDLSRARLSTEVPLTVTVHSDQPIRVTVGSKVLKLPAGHSVRTLPPQSSSASGSSEPALLGLALLATAAWLLHRKEVGWRSPQPISR